MIVMIILLSLLGILILCIVFGFFTFQDYPIFSEDGKYSYQFRRFNISDRQKIAKNLNTEVKEISDYKEFPAERKYRLVCDVYANFDDAKLCAPLLLGIPILIATIVCGSICIVNHTSIVREELFTNYQMQINKLELRASSINNLLEGNYTIKNKEGTVYYITVNHPLENYQEIVNYNEAVHSLKAELYMRKVRCSNPWTSWFWCPGAEMVEGYNKDAKIYTDILPDLMTYDIKYSG